MDTPAITPIVKEFDMSVTKNGWAKSFLFHCTMTIKLDRDELAKWAANTTSPKVAKATELRKLGEKGLQKFYTDCGGKLVFDLLPAGTKAVKPVTITANDAIVKLIQTGDCDQEFLDLMLEKDKISQERYDYYCSILPETPEEPEESETSEEPETPEE